MFLPYNRMLLSAAALLVTGCSHMADSPSHSQGDGLVMDFPAERQDRRILPSGVEVMNIMGTITNVSDRDKIVPDVLIVLRDASDSVVRTRCVTPQSSTLPPDHTIEIEETITELPSSAQFVEIGWVTEDNADWCAR